VIGKDLLDEMVDRINDRAEAVTEALGTPSLRDVFLDHDARVRPLRRRLDRFRLEAHVRWEGKQMSLADAEDLLHAYGTLIGMGVACDVEGLQGVIERGYFLPADEEW
jgi:hypothetical protein